LAAKNTDGGFPSTKGDSSNTSTTSWVVMALNSLGGQDVSSADAYMRSNQEENGSFDWQPGSAGDTFTSSYAVLALTGKFWPVNIFSGTTPTQTPTPTPTSTPTPSPTSTPTVTPTATPSPTPTTTVTPTPTSTPTPTLTPSGTPVPSSVTPSVSPSPTVVPGGHHPSNNNVQKFFRHEQERLHKFQVRESRILEHIQVQVKDTCAHIFQKFTVFQRHK